MNDIISEEWYLSLVDDLRAIHTEAVFNSRWELLIGYHKIGERIAQEHKHLTHQEKYGQKIVKGVAQSTGISERNLWNAMRFYDKYPDINELPNGKNASWTKVVKELLPAPKDEIIVEEERCPTCGALMKRY